MGGSESSVAVQLDLESPNLQSGDLLTGNIHLLVTTATPGTDLLLTLLCDESTEWSESKEESDWSGKRHTKIVNHVGRRNVLTQNFTVFSFGVDGCLPGQYTFPVEIQTAKTMCGSFLYEPAYIPFVHDGPTVAKISYSLVASVQTPTGSITSSRYPLYVTHPTDTAIAPISTSVTANVSTWYWSSQGTVSLSVNFDKNAYIPGETATISIGIDNSQCALQATGITATLIRVIEMRDYRGVVKTERETINSCWQERLVQPGESVKEGDVEIELMIPSNRAIENTTTVATQLINCFYTMTVEVALNGWLTSLGELPQVTRVLVVYPQQMEKPALPEVGGWNPVVMPRRQFSAENYES